MDIDKGMTNTEIAELLRDIAAAYELSDEKKNKFRIIAYQRAADAVEHASTELKDLWDEDRLDQVPGIGTSITAHLDELFRTGRSRHFNSVKKGLPSSMFELMKVPGIGPKTAFKLVNEFKISSHYPLAQLEKIAKQNKIASLEGFGQESQEDIIKSIKEVKGRTVRLLLPYAQSLAAEVIEWIKKNKLTKRADPLGSLRRQASTIGDIDIAAATNQPEKVIEHFARYPKANRVLEKGERTASIILPGSRQVDLMVETPQAYGALLQHFTGSKHHNIALRQYALKRNLSLSDYGIYIMKNGKKTLKKFSSEEKLYNFLGMDWIPPELREDTGEIEAALKHSLPKLVELSDIKADLQIHSNFDIETSHDLGESSMEEIVDMASNLGYEYLAFTEHNPSYSKHNENQIIDILKRKKEKIDKLNYSLKERTANSVQYVFNSLEIDILPDGRIPVPEGGLETLDFALVSIHSSFRLERREMTKRVLEALAFPMVKIFAHPTARKLNVREGIELDWPEVFDFCVKNNKWIEINADPMRLDLPDFLVHEAQKLGVKMTLGTDSHNKEGLKNMPYGVSVARRGWATKNDIVNAQSLKEFKKMLK